MKNQKIGRPVGEVARIILDLLSALGQDDPPLTLRELAHRGQIGSIAARSTVSSLNRSGKVQIVGWRRVHYRNRRVAEYRLASSIAHQDTSASLRQVLSSWR